MIITNDPGGYTYEYIARAKALIEAHETVIIDGFCASGCTFFTAARSCATPKASLFFHSSYFQRGTRRVYDPVGTRAQMQIFPERVREAVRKHGGLTPLGFFIKGEEAQELLGACNG